MVFYQCLKRDSILATHEDTWFCKCKVDGCSEQGAPGGSSGPGGGPNQNDSERRVGELCWIGGVGSDLLGRDHTLAIVVVRVL